MRPQDLVRPEILALKAYPVPSSEGMVKLDAMENPYSLPEGLRHELGLDRPILEQYRTYVTGLMRGDLGISFRNQETVTATISQRYPATVELAVASMVFSVIVSVPFGVVSAIRRGRVADRAISFISPRESVVLTREAVADYVQKNLGRNHVPDEIVFTDKIPRTPVGKPDYVELKSFYQSLKSS